MLVGAETAPEVPCVEAKATLALADIASLGLPDMPAPGTPSTSAGWDRWRCTFPVPLEAL